MAYGAVAGTNTQTGSSPTLEAFANNAQRLSLVGSNPTPRTLISGIL